MSNKNNFSSQDNTQRNRAIIWSVIVLIVLAFMANLGAIIDSIVHPEIDYFDIEHLISGLVTAFVVGIMFVMVIIYIERLKKAIRERNRMDESLKISEQNYRTIFNFATEAIFIHELPTGKIIDVNDTMLKLYGYSSKEEVLSCTIADLSVNVKPYTEEDAQKYILKTINEGPQTFEWKSRRKDGSSFWIEMIVKKTDIGGEERILAVGRDITERKRVKESLIVSESNLQSFINNRNESIWSLNTTYHLIICNEYFKNAYFAAYNVELKAGINLLSILSPELLEFWKPKYDAALAGEKISFEFKETIQGALFYFDVFLNPILSEGKIIGVSAISIDISQLKSAEKTLRASEAQQRFILESLPVAVYTAPVDADRDATWISGDVKKITGFNSEEYIAENDFWRKRLHPEDKDRVLHAYAEKPSAREMILEYRWKCKDGQYYWFQDRSVLVENESRKEYLGIIVDITERKKSEQIIRDLQRRESIGVLAGGIAHDFNNLLAVMMGNVSLAKIRMPADHPSVKNLDRTMTAVERAATLTKQMLAYSGKGRFQVIAVNLVKVVQEHLNLFEASLPKNVSLVTHLSSTPVVVKGDPGQIEQIVMNLIMNGGEAIGEKQGVVNIDVSTVTMSAEELIPFGRLNNQELKSGEYALFQVTDNGSGMDEETITKIFDPFYTTKFIGRGLGLSAVLGIIRGHSGGITVTSVEGTGTTFRVILPLHNVAIDALQPKKQSTEPIGHSPTVMVIDDEQYIVDLAFEIFNEEKYLYFSATDPEKGVQVYKEHWQTIEVVILDYGMPKMNGKEVLIELKKINPTVKVIMQSGYSEDELNHLMGDVKPSAFIQKPYSPKALVSLTTKTLRGT